MGKVETVVKKSLNVIAAIAYGVVILALFFNDNEFNWPLIAAFFIWLIVILIVHKLTSAILCTFAQAFDQTVGEVGKKEID